MCLILDLRGHEVNPEVKVAAFELGYRTAFKPFTYTKPEIRTAINCNFKPRVCAGFIPAATETDFLPEFPPPVLKAE